MIRFPCPSCAVVLKSPEGTEGRKSRCKCGQVVIVPGSAFTKIPTAVLVPDPAPRQTPAAPPVEFTVAPPPLPEPSRPKKPRLVAETREFPSATTGGNFALASVLLAFGAAVMIYLADNSPLIQANGYVVPAICLSIAAMAVAGYGTSRKGLKASFSVGLVFGLCTLVVSVGLAFAIKQRFSEIGRMLPPFSDGAIDRKIEKAKQDLHEALTVGESKQVANARVKLLRVVRGKVPLVGSSSRHNSASADDFLAIYLAIENTSETKILRFLAWGASSDSPIREMRSTLFDDLGNEYDMQHFGYSSRPEGQVYVPDIYPGKSTTDVLVYKLPVDAAKHLHVLLDAARVGGTGTILFRIDVAKIETRQP